MSTPENTISDEFLLDNDVIYMNHAAIAPWPLRTVNAIDRFAKENLRQGSLNYPEWLHTEVALRQQLALLINAASPDDVALVKNTSEALSFVASGIEWHAGDNIVSSNQEFPSNRIVWEALAPQGVELRQAVLADAATAEDALFELVDGRTRLIAVSSVQYGTGLRMDLERIGSFCRERGILFCVDAIQSVGAMRFDIQAIGADFVAADGHKWLLGPEGLGFFYVRPEIRNTLKLTQFGWHMVEAVGDFDRQAWLPATTARRFECGSPNMLSIHALNASLSLLLEVGMELVEQRVLKNSRLLFSELRKIAGVELLTPTTEGRYAGIVTFSLKGVDNALLQQQLQARGVFCAHRAGGIRWSPHFHSKIAHLHSAIAHLVDAITNY